MSALTPLDRIRSGFSSCVCLVIYTITTALTQIFSVYLSPSGKRREREKQGEERVASARCVVVVVVVRNNQEMDWPLGGLSRTPRERERVVIIDRGR